MPIPVEHKQKAHEKREFDYCEGVRVVEYVFLDWECGSGKLVWEKQVPPGSDPEPYYHCAFTTSAAPAVIDVARRKVRRLFDQTDKDVQRCKERLIGGIFDRMKELGATPESVQEELDKRDRERG